MDGLSQCNAKLAIFDILTRPDMHLTGEEEEQVKKVARDLLKTLAKEKLVLDWRKWQLLGGGAGCVCGGVMSKRGDS